MDKEYASYINVGQKWVERIPAHWEMKRLKGVFAMRKERNNPIQTDYILSLTAKQGVVPYAEKEGTGGNKPKDDLTQYNICRENDLLVNCMNVVSGAAGVSRYYGAISPVYYALYPREDENIWYYHYIFRLITFQRSLIGLGKGILMHESDEGVLTSVRMRISMNYLGNVLLPIPPRAEQDQIVRYLDWKISEVNRLISIKKKELKCIEELKKTIAKDAVTGKGKKNMKGSGNDFVGQIPETWEMWPIKRYFNIYTGATPKSGNPDFWNGNICWLTPADYKTHDKYVSSGRKCITEEGYRSCGTTLVPAGSLIFSKRAPVGTVAISKNDVCTSQGCLSCVPKTEDDIEYLYYTFACLSEMFDVVSVGATFKEIATVVFSNLKIPHPPIEEQHEIVKSLNLRFSELNNLVNVKKKQIEGLEDLKAKIISDAVTGKVDVREIVIPEYEYMEDESDEDICTDSDDEEIEEQED